MSETALRKVVRSYFEYRGYTQPSTDQAMMFLMSEVGELADCIVQGQANWVRNNPENKSGEKEAIANEIGDVLCMLTILADTLDIDPLPAMLKKFMEKGWSNGLHKR